MNYNFFVSLNDAGMKIWGEVFSDGFIPVISLIPNIANLPIGKSKIYLVRHEELDQLTREKLLSLLAERFKAPVEAIRKQMNSIRIPIREKYVSHSGSSRMELLV